MLHQGAVFVGTSLKVTPLHVFGEESIRISGASNQDCPLLESKMFLLRSTADYLTRQSLIFLPGEPNIATRWTSRVIAIFLHVADLVSGGGLGNRPCVPGGSCRDRYR
jgi:hypothetical protein